MAHYRAYLLDHHGNIQAVRKMECAGDYEARSTASRLSAHYPIEVWKDARKVARFDPRATASEAKAS